MRRFRPFRELEESFNKLAEELGRNEVLRNDFIHDFSHEFKTPIVSISGFAKLLQKGNLTEEQQAEYLSIIETESEKLSNMAMNVLDMSKLDNVGVLTDITRFNLSEQLRHCVLMLEKKWGEKNQEIEIDLPEYYVSGNEDMLSEVWINLLDNAIKFSPEGGKIIVKVFQRDNSLSVEVRNTGKRSRGKTSTASSTSSTRPTRPTRPSVTASASPSANASWSCTGAPFPSRPPSV